MEHENDIEKQEEIKRPWILSILCIVFFVHSTVLIFLFLLGTIYNTWLTEVINNFAESNSYGKAQVFIISIAGFFLYGFFFTGTFYLWKMKKKGLIILVTSVFLILIFTFFIGAGSMINCIIYIVLLLLLALFYRKLS